MAKRTILDLEGKPLVINAEDNHCGTCHWRCGERRDFCGVFKDWLVCLGVWIRPYECRKSEDDAAKERAAQAEVERLRGELANGEGRPVMAWLHF